MTHSMMGVLLPSASRMGLPSAFIFQAGSPLASVACWYFIVEVTGA